ncbi:hypothetical protein MAPG_11706 [Magnaporthiopsis poae ATCC 64411]|uniref:Uncharacterized protein n=1 Tax=Magnaporthiopsis poae (strain ATCC 64411 / 73-15) TaxID=644358 RepID=A0A0C4EFZ4_MAGP6|nr:hypothetical protein MAPG_11706 [Magnaporthiopsis poae ATCC 64411]
MCRARTGTQSRAGTSMSISQPRPHAAVGEPPVVSHAECYAASAGVPAAQPVGGEVKSVALGRVSRKCLTARRHHEAPRGAGRSYYSNGRVSDILRCDRVLLLAGGIGITGMLPWMHQQPSVKLVWSVAESARCLVEAVDLEAAPGNNARMVSRFDVRELVACEAEAGWDRFGVAVSWPGSVCDDVRAAVAEAGRNGRTVFALEVDAYSWCESVRVWAPLLSSRQPDGMCASDESVFDLSR